MKTLKKKKYDFVNIIILVLLCLLILPGFVKIASTDITDTYPEGLFLNSIIKQSPLPRDISSINSRAYSNTIEIFPTGSMLVNSTYLGKNGSDTLTVRYQGDDNQTLFDCDKSIMSADQTTESLFFISAKGDLVCKTINRSRKSEPVKNKVIKGAEAMHIRYGQDIDQDGTVDRYISGNDEKLQLGQVTHVKISLLIKSTDLVDPRIEEKYYTLQDLELGPFKDHYFRKVYTVTIPVNRK